MNTMSNFKDTNSIPDGYRALNTSELQELLQDEEKMDQIVRLNEKFQELQVDREILLTSNRSLAEESLARRPLLNNGKLQLAEKYRDLTNLATACWEKQSRLEADIQKHSLQTAQNLLQEDVVRAEEQSEDKPAPIPDRPKEWNPRAPPEFVRDVMGSSAGAGSGEFHVYRHLRRREYQRQDFLDKMTEKQKMDLDYLDKVSDNQQAADVRTAKRRKKREKLKQKKLMAKKAKQDANKGEDSEKSSSSSEEDDQEREAEDDAEAPSFVMGKR
uniref:VPS37D subunit of ESCRT-I n=1 Tax=Oncorhynchus kisutch TaxID=8019 RepID=A0A8C7KWC2_ONCKI